MIISSRNQLLLRNISKLVQVDGGSEFIENFEDACAQLKLPLIVLPPKKPEYNGGIE
ncbi:hypothetical protein P618_201133 [Holospora obtusa F1]|uniref:Integrase catalytic domain-containing protein n=1 Tax=Holospora obtusa F1 TaxID=1399147 RepID=W6TS65_HOLOB|nr:hypothetical protein P618_201133 [Holospora obtusa F1]